MTQFLSSVGRKRQWLTRRRGESIGAERNVARRRSGEQLPGYLYHEASALVAGHRMRNHRTGSSKRYTVLFTVAMVALLSAACSSTPAGTSATNGKAPTTVSIGVLPNGTQAPLFVAKALGYYRQRGLNVNLVSFGNGPAAVQAVEAGSVQGAAQASTVLLGAAARGIPVVGAYTFATYAHKRSPEGLVVSAASGITTVSQLKGKTIAVSGLGTDQDYVFLLDKYLPAGGLTAKQVSIVEVPFTNQGAALERGQVAAAVAFDPALSLMRADPSKFRVIAQIQQFLPTSSYPENVLVLSRNFMNSSPQVAKAVVAATVEGVRYVKAHPADAAKIVAAATNGVAANDLATLRDLAYTTSTAPPLGAYSALEAAMRAAGVLSGSIDLNQYVR